MKQPDIRLQLLKFVNQSVHMQLQSFAVRGTAVKKMATPLQRAKYVVCLVKTRGVT
jgi:hypothetical protein